MTPSRKRLRLGSLGYKHNYLVKRIEDLPRVMHEAFYVARSGRPGPVVIDLPKDILMGLGQYEDFSQVEHRTYQPTIKAGKSEIEKAVSMIASAKKPLLLRWWRYQLRP